MPFIYDFENIDCPEDRGDDFWPEPTPEEYQYLKPAEFGGTADPVQFEVPTQLAPRRPASADQRNDTVQRGVFSRLIRRIIGTSQVGRTLITLSDTKHSMSGRSAEEQRRRSNLFCIMTPALTAFGGLYAICDYDGGNDEGFAWFRSLRTANTELNRTQLVSLLISSGVLTALRSAEFIHESPEYPRTEHQHLEDVLNAQAEEWGVLLLGWGFGTGPYQMFGSFTVNLVKHTIIDDPNATPPEEGNIRFPSHGGDSNLEKH